MKENSNEGIELFSDNFWKSVKKVIYYDFDEEIYELYADKYWQPLKAQEQPYEAFAINSKHIVRVFLDKMEEENE